MTNPSNITVSLEWAKRLKEAGWPQDNSIYCWRVTLLKGSKRERRTLIPIEIRRPKEDYPNPDAIEREDFFAAPTAEEILRMLPDILEERFSLIIFRDYNREEKKQEWCLMYEHIPNRMPLYSESSDTLANAASAMFVFLSENNLLPTP